MIKGWCGCDRRITRGGEMGKFGSKLVGDVEGDNGGVDVCGV